MVMWADPITGTDPSGLDGVYLTTWWGAAGAHTGLAIEVDMPGRGYQWTYINGILALHVAGHNIAQSFAGINYG